MKNEDAIRPVDPNGEIEALDREALDKTTGGADSRTGVKSFFCEKCGFPTPHELTKTGKRKCRYCGTVSQ